MRENNLETLFEVRVARMRVWLGSACLGARCALRPRRGAEREAFSRREVLTQQGRVAACKSAKVARPRRLVVPLDGRCVVDGRLLERASAFSRPKLT